MLTSTNITEEDKKLFSKVMEKFYEFFKVRHNVIFERASEISYWERVPKKILPKFTDWPRTASLGRSKMSLFETA